MTRLPRWQNLGDRSDNSILLTTTELINQTQLDSTLRNYQTHNESNYFQGQTWMGRVKGQKVHVHKTTTSQHSRICPLSDRRISPARPTTTNRVFREWRRLDCSSHRHVAVLPLLVGAEFQWSSDRASQHQTQSNAKHKRTSQIISLCIILRSGSPWWATTSVAGWTGWSSGSSLHKQSAEMSPCTVAQSTFGSWLSLSLTDSTMRVNGLWSFYTVTGCPKSQLKCSEGATGANVSSVPRTMPFWNSVWTLKIGLSVIIHLAALKLLKSDFAIDT